ncbi:MULTISPECIES: hypothetical protein [unclassified Microbacterium]|uniref:hypothetical protein n=2 Tax=Microbacterium TaxID=33882 RepID=UPI00049355E2|nr:MULTISPECIES: hypothetical protein [unclassified Microbacterium]
MRRSPGILRSAGTVAPPVIMRLITTASLALLLLFAFAVTTHGAQDENGAAPSLTAAVVDAFDDAAAAAQEQVLTAAPDSGTSALVGAALCALGVLCGLAVMLLRTRAAHRRALVTRLRAGSEALRRSSASPPRPRATTLSLLQLGLSRT